MKKEEKEEKEIKCFAHLYSSKSDYISAIKIDGSNYFALLPNKGNGYKVEIDQITAENIQCLWDRNEYALMSIDGGQIIETNIITNSQYKIYKEES